MQVLGFVCHSLEVFCIMLYMSERKQTKYTSTDAVHCLHSSLLHVIWTPLSNINLQIHFSFAVNL